MQEFFAFFETIGVDGVFTDQPHQGGAFLDRVKLGSLASADFPTLPWNALTSPSAPSTFFAHHKLACVPRSARCSRLCAPLLLRASCQDVCWWSSFNAYHVRLRIRVWAALLHVLHVSRMLQPSVLAARLQYVLGHAIPAHMIPQCTRSCSDCLQGARVATMVASTPVTSAVGS